MAGGGAITPGIVLVGPIGGIPAGGGAVGIGVGAHTLGDKLNSINSGVTAGHEN